MGTRTRTKLTTEQADRLIEQILSSVDIDHTRTDR